MTTETRPVQIKPNIFDIFIGGARKGWNLATQNLVPNILMAYPEAPRPRLHRAPRPGHP